jgi:hypothetical protein
VLITLTVLHEKLFSRLANAGILTQNVLHKTAERNTLHSLTAPCYVSRLKQEIKSEKCDTVQTIYVSSDCSVCCCFQHLVGHYVCFRYNPFLQN